VRNFILEELADALDDRSGQFRYFFLTSSGRLAPYAADDPSVLRASARNDALPVRPISHAEAAEMVSDFIETLLDGELVDKLRAATAGSINPARFLQTISAYPRARRSWVAYRQRRLEAVALEFLRNNNVDLARYGLDVPARAQEEETGLRFDQALEGRLARLRDRLRAFTIRGGEANRARADAREQMRLEEVYHSNAIRGNRLDQRQTEEAILRGACVGGLTLREHLEAVNLYRALGHAATLAASDAPLTEHAIRELHAQLFASIDDENAGVYRRTDARIVGRDYLPPESVLVPALVREFMEWLDESSADAVAKACAAQARLANIAPFLDGNGRVGRILSNVILDRAGYPPVIVQVGARDRYYDSLRQADAGDMSGLLSLTIDCVETSMNRLESALGGTRPA
jgi:fido (protein-threonine AMPylation protein)